MKVRLNGLRPLNCPLSYIGQDAQILFIKLFTAKKCVNISDRLYVGFGTPMMPSFVLLMICPLK